MKFTRRDGVCVAVGMVATPVLLKVYRYGKKLIKGRSSTTKKKPVKRKRA